MTSTRITEIVDKGDKLEIRIEGKDPVIKPTRRSSPLVAHPTWRDWVR